MSWPTDGKPRYVADVQPVSENIPRAVVYDRAVCHRVVFSEHRIPSEAAAAAEAAASRLNAA